MKVDGFLDLSVVGQEVFLLNCFYIVLNLPPDVSEMPLMAILGLNDTLFLCLCPLFEFNFIVLEIVAPSKVKVDIKVVIYVPFICT